MTRGRKSAPPSSPCRARRWWNRVKISCARSAVPRLPALSMISSVEMRAGATHARASLGGTHRLLRFRREPAPDRKAPRRAAGAGNRSLGASLANRLWNSLPFRDTTSGDEYGTRCADDLLRERPTDQRSGNYGGRLFQTARRGTAVETGRRSRRVRTADPPDPTINRPGLALAGFYTYFARSACRFSARRNIPT